MTALDDRLIPKVHAIVAKYGKVLTFYNNVGDTGTYDPETGLNTEPAEDTQAVKCTPPEAVKTWDEGALSSTGRVRTLLPTKDLNATFFGSSFDIGTRVDWDSGSYAIESINKIYSGDSIAAYDLILRPTSEPKP